MKTSLLLLVALAMFCYCSQPGDGSVTGSGSRSPNAPCIIKGSVQFKEAAGKSMDYVEIKLFKINEPSYLDYEWEKLKTVFPDSQGNYQFDTVATGSYTVIAEEFSDDPWAYLRDMQKGFSGYFDFMEEESTLVLDTIVISPSLSVVGIFQNAFAQEILVSVIGTQYSTLLTDTYLDQHFAFSNMPVGHYNMKIITDPNDQGKMYFYTPLPTDFSQQLDTVYTQELYGQKSVISITGNVVELSNQYFTVTCMVVSNNTNLKTVSRDKAVEFYRRQLLDFIYSR